MNNVFVYLELEGAQVADVSLELLTKGRKLANQLGCQLEAIAAGTNLEGIEKQVLPFGVDPGDIQPTTWEDIKIYKPYQFEEVYNNMEKCI